MLRALSVSRSFEGVQALDDVTLELHQREVVGLIGPNGAGKSTLVNLMTGFDLPTAGRIELDGREITGWSPHRRARSGLARTFQHSKSFRDLTVRENVEVAALGVGAGAARGAHARRRAARAARPDGSGGGAGGIARARRRAAPGRCARPRDAPELRAHGRARSRPARGGGAGVRGRRARRARRPRRGRAADRPQHGADHGRLRPHPRARPGGHAGHRALPARSAPTSTSPPPTSARARYTRRTPSEPRHARDRRARRELRRRRRRAWPLDRGRQGRDRGPDRAERSGQVHDAARRHGPRRARDTARSGSRAPRCMAARRRRSRARASRSCRRGGASSPI